MQTEYTLDKEDYLAYQLFTASQSPNVIKSRRRNRLIVPILYIITGALLYYLESMTFLYTFIILAVLWFIFYPAYSRRIYRRHYSKHLDEHYRNRFDRRGVLSLEDDAIMMIDEGSEGRVKYTEIDAVNEIPGYFFVTLKNGLSLILPKNKISEPLLSQMVTKIVEKSGAARKSFPDWKWK